MIIWVIAAAYQGTYDGVEFATFDEEVAQKEYQRLIRESVEMFTEPWDEVENFYDWVMQDDNAKYESYYIEGVPTGTRTGVSN